MKMRKVVFGFYLPVVLMVAGLFSCETRKTENEDKPAPQVFTPQTETSDTTLGDDSVASGIETKPEKSEPAETEVARKPMPTVAELKTVTASQEAKRELSKDAMQIFRMKPDAFKNYMQSRVPYYQGKGNLKAENDMVRIEINAEEMRVQTTKESFSFPMK